MKFLPQEVQRKLCALVIKILLPSATLALARRDSRFRENDAHECFGKFSNYQIVELPIETQFHEYISDEFSARGCRFIFSLIRCLLLVTDDGEMPIKIPITEVESRNLNRQQ